MIDDLQILKNEIGGGEDDHIEDPIYPLCARRLGEAFNIAFRQLDPPVRARGSSKYKREARLLFCEQVVGRGITTTKDLTRAEARAIARWVDGRHPCMRVFTDWVERPEIRLRRRKVIQRWMYNHHGEIAIRVARPAA